MSVALPCASSDTPPDATEFHVLTLDEMAAYDAAWQRFQRIVTSDEQRRIWRLLQPGEPFHRERARVRG